jgi:hypothetical protein
MLLRENDIIIWSGGSMNSTLSIIKDTKSQGSVLLTEIEAKQVIKEIDLNPVFAYKDSALAVDARIVLEQ